MHSTKNTFNLQGIYAILLETPRNHEIPMGRKSNAKKKVRKLVEEKEKTQKKKFLGKKTKKELKKEIIKSKKASKSTSKSKKKKTSPSSKLKAKVLAIKQKVDKRTFFGGVFTLIMLLILVSVAYLIFEKAFRPTPLAKYLPEEHTIALLELNTNTEHNQFFKTFELLEDYSQYSPEKIKTYMENKFSINFDTDVSPWLGRQTGVAYIHSQKEKGKILKFYFAEIFSPKNATDFLSGKELESYEGHKIYKLEQPLYITFIDEYLVFTTDEAGIYEFIDMQKDSPLYSSAKYRKINNNLPLSKAAFLYIDFDEMTDGFFKELPILSEKGVSMETIQPLTKLFEAEGFALIAMDDNFAIESFLSLDTGKLKGGQYITFANKYNARLTEYILDDVVAFWGGANLEYQLKRMVEVLAGGDKAAILVFEHLLESYAQKYFGQETNLEKDILKLFSSEFALAIEQIDEKYIYKLVIELDNPNTDAIKLQELANNFALTGGIFEPKVVEHELEDGTISRELVAIPEEVVKNEIEYNGKIIYGLEMGKRDWGIYYTLIDDIAVIANNILGVESTIDILENNKKSLKETAIFTHNIRPVLRTSDEVSYFNSDGLFPILFGKKVIPDYLKPIESLSSGKNYFNDGIKTINYLRIKAKPIDQ